MQLITYANRLAGNLRGLDSLLRNELRDLFDGVHILPFFDPVDGADAGFDPVDHTRVDPRVGAWADIKRIAEGHRVMADLIVNHVSAQSPQFVDVRRRGEASPHWPMFLRKDAFFAPAQAGMTPAQEIARIYRPRPGAPFSTVPLDDGRNVDFWTTFSANQLDIDVESPAGQRYLDGILDRFADAGVREVRLDAAGYAIKRRGTSCFMLAETFDFISQLGERAAARGMQTLVEVHSHYQTQIDIAASVGRVYDFALPPLILHTLYAADDQPLRRWLSQAPRNCVTVLDTHDGIGIVDAARDADRPGLLEDQQIDDLVEGIHQRTGGASRRASGHAASNLDVYQINSTYYDALGRDDTAYLIARALQFFSPGDPQVYYVGLLAGHNDLARVEQTDVGRDINRHAYTTEALRDALRRPVVQQLIHLMRLRREHQGVFHGTFQLPPCPAHELRLRWERGQECAELHVRLREGVAQVEFTSADDAQRWRIANGLLSKADE